MDKITLYKKGGKLFYKDKSGKMCEYKGGGPIKFRKPLPTYQDSGTLGVSNPYKNEIIDRVDLENQDKKKSGQWSNYINIAGVGFSQLNDKFNPYKKSDNPYIQSSFGGNQGGRDAVDQGYTTGVSAVSSVNPLIGSIVGAGRSMSDMIAGENKETGEANPVRRAIANQLSPSSKHEQGMKTGQEFGAGWGILEGLTGVPIGDVMRADKRKRAEKELEWDKNRNAMFDSSQPSFKRNDTIYAKEGTTINKPMKLKNGDWNAEIENGEIVLGNPKMMQHGGNSTTSHNSSFAVKFNGDKHGQDNDNDGQEGVPINAPEGSYVASNYLGLNGKPATGKIKTVAKVMEPYVKALAKAENSTDKYKNNPLLIKHHLKQLNNIKQEAETNKIIEEVSNNSNKMQLGGKIIPRQDMEDYATNKMNVPSNIVRSAGEDNPDNYNFQNPDKYKGYEVDAEYTDEEIPMVDNEVNISDKITNSDEREGSREDITTLDKMAGKSNYTGTSNLIQEKIREMIGEDVFNEDGKITPQWKNKIKSEYGVSDDELDNATMQNITQGNVGKAFGKMLERAYGVLGKGKDETSNKVDVNVSGNTAQPDINNKMTWAQDILNNIKSNSGVLPSEYSNLPEDLKDELLTLARQNKSITDGRFGPSLTDAFKNASTENTEEIDRQQSYTFNEQEAEGQRIDENYDLNRQGINGRKLTFNEAFRYARENDLEKFKWNGKSYAAKTRSEDPELAKASRAISNKQSINPTNNNNITPQEMNKKVNNPKRTLSQLKYGGMLQKYQNGNPVKPTNQIQPITPTNISNPYQAYNNKLLLNNMNKTAADVWDYNNQLDKQRAQMINQQNFTKNVQSRLPNYNRDAVEQAHKSFTKYQQGGEMEQEMPNESHEAMMQLAQGQDPNMQEQIPQQPGADQEMQGRGQVPVQIAELQPELQQMFMQLTPEQQQKILSLPPDQIEIALMTLMQQMMQGGQGQPVQQPSMEQSQVPQGVMDQFQ